MARLYTNENFPYPAADELRRLGHDVLTVQESGNANQATPDEEVLRFAVSEGRILVTLNRLHFIRLHRKNPDHMGIIVCSLDADFSALADRIHGVLREKESLNGRLIRVNRESMDAGSA